VEVHNLPSLLGSPKNECPAATRSVGAKVKGDHREIAEPLDGQILRLDGWALCLWRSGDRPEQRLEFPCDRRLPLDATLRRSRSSRRHEERRIGCEVVDELCHFTATERDKKRCDHAFDIIGLALGRSSSGQDGYKEENQSPCYPRPATFTCNHQTLQNKIEDNS